MKSENRRTRVTTRRSYQILVPIQRNHQAKSVRLHFLMRHQPQKHPESKTSQLSANGQSMTKIPKQTTTNTSKSLSEANQKKERKEYFVALGKRLETASSFQELQLVARGMEEEMQTKWPVSCSKQLDAGQYIKDRHAASLYPTDAPPDLAPVCIYGDGNCLPRCASLLAVGNQDSFAEMRVRITVELAANEDCYLSDENLQPSTSFSSTSSNVSAIKEYASYSSQFTKEELSVQLRDKNGLPQRSHAHCLSSKIHGHVASSCCVQCSPHTSSLHISTVWGAHSAQQSPADDSSQVALHQ